MTNEHVVFVVHLFLASIGLFVIGSTSALAETPAAPPETIILISLDTTRADHLSCYGYEHETTPNIDALAKESLFFEQPFSPVPSTHPSHSSIFTGVIPPTHGVHENFQTNLSESALTLTEILKADGYATYGIVSTVVLKSDRGLSQGFDHYDDAMGIDDTAPSINGEQKGNETTARALKWLNDNAEKKKFMFIHYYDPHAKYEPPAPFDTRFENPYDGEIAFTDHCVGQILDRLKALGLYDRALIALVGDHGELLGEHDEAEHSFFIYQNVLRVPMMFKLPGATQAKKISEPCSLIDVTPTLLSIAGLSVPESMQGVDLTGYLRPDFTLPNRAIYSESMTPTSYMCSSLLGIVMGRWHYIQTTRPELYDRIADPMEMNNLIAQHPTRASEMKERLRGILSDAERPNAGEAATLDAEVLEELEALGYMESGVTVDYSFEEGKKDAKDIIEARNRLLAARRLHGEGREKEAVEACLEIIKQYPDIRGAYNTLAASYVELDELENAIVALEQKTSRFTDDHTGLMHLSGMYEVKKNYTKQIETLNKVVALKADDALAHKTLINIYMEQHATDKALEAQNKMHAEIPPDATTMMTLGIIYLQKNDLSRALTSFLDVLALDPKSLGARINAANLYLEMGSPEQALQLCEQGLTQGVDTPVLRGLMARVRMNPGYPHLFDPQSALVHAQTALQLSKDTKDAYETDVAAIYETLATAWIANGNIDEAMGPARIAAELYGQKGLSAQARKMLGLVEYLKRQ